MRQELKRIEAALHQLADQSRKEMQPGSKLNPPVRVPPSVLAGSISFQVQAKPPADAPPPPSAPPLPTAADLSPPTPARPPAIDLSDAKTPLLPKVKMPSFTSHRNAANPALAMNLLQEIQAIVVGWQDDLQQVVRQIQDLYLEGPIVDGWLESYSQEEDANPTFRHADVECLMDYVEKAWGVPGEADPTASSAEASLQPEPNAAGYRLCGLNEDGQVWFRHCPPEQVPAVSLAIARYQKLRQLSARKQDLETRLSQLAKTLVDLHSQLKR